MRFGSPKQKERNFTFRQFLKSAATAARVRVKPMRKYAVIALENKMAFDYATATYEDINDAIEACKLLRQRGLEANVYERYYF